MQKLVTALLVSLTLILIAPAANGQETASPSALTPPISTRIATTSAKPAVTDQRMARIIQKSDAEIERRINALTNLLNTFNQARKLSLESKTSLSTQIQDYITELTALKKKIDTQNSDLATLRTDAKSIYTDFRVYAVFMPKLALLAAADRIAVTIDTLTEIQGKLQSQIFDLKAKGYDVAALETLIADMNAKIANAKTLIAEVQTDITPLTPDGYPGNKTGLNIGKNKIKAASQDLKTAKYDAEKILQRIRILNSTPLQATPSAQKVSTPSAMKVSTSSAVPASTSSALPPPTLPR
jgi:chromosome segregation ATPase